MNLQERKFTERLRHKYGLLFSLLSVLILVEILTVFAVLASQRFATERALSGYTDELLKNVVDETQENAAGYLRQAQDSVSLASRILEAQLLDIQHPAQLERYFLEQLRVVPQIDAIFFGDRDGNFVFSKRESVNAESAFFSKIIRVSEPKAERATLVDRDSLLAETGRRTDPEDSFDPRSRPWFALASTGNDEIWTDPYIFYTSQKPGLTVARSVRDVNGELIGVIGADIELDAVSEFLKTQRVGKSGAAFIIYSNGDVLAHPNSDQLAQRDEGGKLRLKMLSEFDTVTAQAGARLNEQFPDLTTLKQSHYDKFEADDRSYLSMFVPLFARGSTQWIMGIYAPEDELAYKIREGQRESIFLGVVMSLLVVTAAVLIGLIMLRPLNVLQRQATEDSLTGLLNRRSFDQIGKKRLAKCHRARKVLSAVMIDIDRFKSINDEHGHATGDEVLLAVARRVERGLSDTDTFARYGGEEFALVLPNASLAKASKVAERLREVVASEPIKTNAGPLEVSISLGVAETHGTDDTLAALLDRADQCLLAAKRQGRNRVASEP